ncbi:hypothetical protein AQI88_28305 [Streptomyces cellostaticus]|uniref:Uncharacterized protein n=1 Tax=Streptomyces cellostaticus TaxID=67285 RepID=A0A101NH23_9ACTN|nr:hypothetical protein [Streptomyces cellostaticus]KUM93030.1 hypothetical protein AQI88_28305 [Streptomyces cellostaticus]GHI06049.1 hypothetical protein Scel_43700 [Streptomyces cellostaticus]
MTVTAGTAQGPRPEGETPPRRARVAPAGGRPVPQGRGGSVTGGPGPGLRLRRQAGAARAALRRRFWATVPARLRLLRAATVLLATAVAMLLTVAGLAANGTWDSVADRDAPRTTSAADLGLALNDMDAQAANILLSSGDAGKGRLRTPYTKAVGFYGDARREISHDLRTLAVAAQGDRSDEKTVEHLTDDFAEYQELIGRALENDGHSGGKPAALADYRRATDLLRSRLLPAASTLVSSNDAAFDAEYSSAHSALDAQQYALLSLGVLLLAALGVLQWYLARSFRRILNPGVLAATVCTLLAVILGAQALSTSADHLRVARHDAFDSVVALSRARALAYDANADESRYLLDAQRREQYAESFLAKSQKLYGIRGATLDTYDAGLATTWQAYETDHHDLRFTGEFRRELDNITFPGERAAAEKTVRTYAVYQRDDRKIRALVAAGKEREATEFCMDWQPGTSNARFGTWMAALDQVAGINRAHFDASVRAGRSVVNGLLPWAGVLLLAAVILTGLGLRPRLAEFG